MKLERKTWFWEFKNYNNGTQFYLASRSRVGLRFLFLKAIYT